MPQSSNPIEGVERTVATPVIRRAATVRPATFDDEDRSVEVMMSTGAAVLRFDWMDDEYYDETLGMEEGEVRLERINEYAPLLDTHSSWSLSDVIGSVVPGTVRIENGEMIGRVRFSSTPDVADIVTKVREGDIKKVSIQYQVYVYELRDPGDGKRREMRAVDWEPIEVSFCALPAEFAAGARSGALAPLATREQPNPQGGHPCTIRGAAADSKERTMETPNPAPTLEPTPVIEPTPASPPPPSPEPEVARAAQVAATQIRERAAAGGLGDAVVIDLLARHADRPMSKADLDAELVDRFVATRRIDPIDNSITIVSCEKDKYRAALTAAIHARMTESPAPPKDGGELFGHMSVREMARDFLMRSGVRGHAAMGVHDFWGAALGMQRHGAQTTSDFALALQSAGTQAILDEYQAADDQQWRQLAREKSASDFRPVPAVGLTGTPEFLVIEENAEYTYGAFAETGTSWRLLTFGRALSFSRQALINDNLGLFSDISTALGRGASLAETNAFWALLLSNVVMADGLPLFHASHGNLASSGSALSVASLSAGRLALRKMKDRDGVTPITVVPKFLIIGPESETLADQLLTVIQATQIANVTPAFIRSLTVIVEPRITDYSWYLAADPRQTPSLQTAYLNGQRGIFTDSRVGFDVDGIEYKGRLDFNAHAVDHRGVYKNPGAAPS